MVISNIDINKLFQYKSTLGGRVALFKPKLEGDCHQNIRMLYPHDFSQQLSNGAA
jgi:hypothetical protein